MLLSGVVTTLAGNGTPDSTNGTGTAASFNAPFGAAVIPSTGVIVVADSSGHRIRLVTQAGVVTTLAGSGTPAFADGTGAGASFNSPIGVAVTPSSSTIVVADGGNNRIRLVSYPGGVVTTLAGGGTGSPSFDGTGAAAYFSYPYGVAVIPSSGNIAVADLGTQRIRIITPAGVVTTLAGSGSYDFADGTGAAARFRYPAAIAVIPSSEVMVVADRDNHRIRLVTPAGVVTTLAGSGNYASADGTGAAASFAYPIGVAMTSSGDIVVSEQDGNRIRLVTQAGVVTTLAGSGTPAFADGTGEAVSFNSPRGVAVLPNGNIVVADYSNNRIRLVTPTLIPKITGWSDKSGQSNTMTGTATWSGGTMVFNGTTNAFSNTAYPFPFGAYSMFAVYSNTTAPAASAYMNAVYGSNGFPMMGTFGPSRSASARSVVANTGALSNPVPVGWAARIASSSSDQGRAIATDSSGNVFVTGSYGGALTLFNSKGVSNASLAFSGGGTDCFVAKYSPAGMVLWAARIESALNDVGFGIATDPSGNVFVTGSYASTLTVYNSSGVSNASLPLNAGTDCFIAKYSSAGAVLWAARIESVGNDVGNAIATDSSGNVFVTGSYGNPPTLYNSSGVSNASLGWSSGVDCFIAKYSSAGAVLWAARMSGIGGDIGYGVATDSSGNVFVTGTYGSTLTVYNSSGVSNASLAFSGGGSDCFLAKYSSAGAVLWAARIASSSNDVGYGVATDPSGNVFVTGQYRTGALSVYPQGSITASVVLSSADGIDCFVAKYSSAGAVLWAAKITAAGSEYGNAIATDSSGNVFVTGQYAAALTLYNSSGVSNASLGFTGGNDCFVAKYSSAGAVLWATRIAGTTTSSDIGYGIATDSSGNVFVTGQYGAALTLFDPNGASNAALAFSGGTDIFIAKYNSDGYIANAPTPASSNVLVSATYTPSTFSSFVNGFAQTTLAGTTLTTVGLFLGGPSNYFSGSISEVLVFGTTLTAAQRQSVEGYLSRKWGIGTGLISTHPFYTIGPFNRYFNPTDVPGCSLWLDGIDNSSMNSTTTVTSWSDKSGLNNTMTGTATWTGRAMSFNGSTQAFSNTAYVFPISNYSMFAVYSNTTAPAASAYMNAVYGSNGFPMLGTFGNEKAVSVRSVVANTGGVAGNPVGWAARIGSTAGDYGGAIATDTSGSVFVIGLYSAAVTLFNSAGATGAALSLSGGNYNTFVAKYSSAGAVLWAAQLASTTAHIGYGIATDTSGNVYVSGGYYGPATFYSTGGAIGATLPHGSSSYDGFVAKYSSAGAVLWAAQITGGGNSGDYAYGIDTDSSGNVFVIGIYGATLSLASASSSGGASASLPLNAGTDCFIAKYSSAGAVLWAARMTSDGTDSGYGISTDTLGNVFVSGHSPGTLTLYNQGFSGSAFTTLTNLGSLDAFVAKYSSAGAVLWVAKIAGTITEYVQAIATDTSDNVFVTGYYDSALTLYNSSGISILTLPSTGGVYECYLAKYSSAGAVLWAARVTGGTVVGNAVATDTSGNVYLTGSHTGALTVYNQGPSGTVGATLPTTGGNDCFIAKYSSAGAVLGVTRIASTGSDNISAIATDTSGNVFVTGNYDTALTLYNQGGGPAATLPTTGFDDIFVAKYSPDGLIAAPVTASSNVLVSATYTPSTFSPFVNGSTAPTLAGTTLATTGIFVGGPSNYFNGTISELLIYSANLSAAQRQQVEGYLIQKWGLSAQTLSNHQYKLIPPAASQPAQLDEVTPGNWTRDWQPYLRSLVAANASATPTYSVLTGTLAGYKIGFLAPNGNIYLPPHAVNQGCALITPTPTGATFSTTAITGVSTGQIYGNDWIGGAMYPDGMLYLIPFDASYNNTPGIANLDTNTNVFRSNPYTAGNTTNFNLQFMSGTMAPDGNMFILPYAVATGGAVSLRFFNPITKLMVAYSVNKPTAERFSAAILAPNGNIYGVAITGPAQACMINPTARTFTTIGSNATVQYRGLVYGGNGSIYMIPNANATGIGILNTTTNTITANAIAGGLGYYGGVLGPDGNIYCIPSTATNIGVINTRTNTFSTLGSVAANSYGSAVLAPNGKIYLIPFGASAIGMISFTGLNMLPSTSFCLSPYVNRGFFTQ